MRRLLMFALCCVLPQVAAAQSTTVANDSPAPLPPAVRGIIKVFGRPLHPIVGVVAPGGKIGVGFGYDTPRDQDWFHNASALVTLNRYWSVEGETGYQTHRSRVGLFGEARHMSRIDFFGTGPQSDRANRTDFRLRENTVGARGWFRPRADVRVGGSAQAYSPALGTGASHDVLSIEELFHPGELPGLNRTPLFGQYRGFAEFLYPTLADPDQPDAVYQGYQGTYQVAIETVHDHDGGLYNFHRFETEVQQRFTGFKPGQRLTLHGLMAVTNASAVVPFYLQYTLGGGGLNPFRPDTIGTDGTTQTLRSYPNYRFRDRDTLLLQAEYRVPIHGPVHGTIFYDAGQVAGRPGALFDGLKQGTGFSVSYMNRGATLGRLDVGYGSGEGVHLYWGFGLRP
jgi:hypothetical protein